MVFQIKIQLSRLQSRSKCFTFRQLYRVQCPSLAPKICVYDITGVSISPIHRGQVTTAITCTGKLTNFSASYWHQLLMMLDRELYEYL